MANSLLDFVMSLVRDPDAAAQYAADPAQAIAAANLTDVTSADVNHLIPVVAESMSTAVPSGASFGGADTLLDSAHNVWASGAATAAFDSFDDHLPIRGVDVFADHVPSVLSSEANVIALPEDSTPTVVGPGLDDTGVPTIATDPGPLGAPLIDDGHVPDPPAIDDPHHDVAGTVDDHVGQLELVDHLDDHLDHPQDPGFDVFT